MLRAGTVRGGAWGVPPTLDLARLVPAALAVATGAILVGLPYPANLVLLAAVAAFVVSLIAPPWGIGLIVASIPVQALGIVDLGAFDVTFTRALLAGTAAAWVVGLPTRRHRLTGASGRIALCFAAYVLVVALSVVNVRSVPAWTREFERWWSALVLFVVAASLLRGPAAARPVLLGVAAGTAGVAVVAVYQVVEKLGPPSYSVDGVTRAYGTFGHPNPFAGYLGVTVPLLVAVAGGALLSDCAPAGRRVFGRGLPLACGLAGVAGLAALALTQSRGGWLGAVVGVGAVVWLLGGRVRWLTVVLVGVTTVVALATPVGGRVAARAAAGVVDVGPVVEVTPANFAVRERLAHVRAGVAMARAYPWLGVGAGNFSARYREFTPVWRFRIPRGGHAHNAYVHAAAQTGLVGLATYLGFVAMVGLELVGALRRVGPSAVRPVVVGAIGVCLAIAAHNTVDYMHVLGLNLQVAVVLALAMNARPGAAEEGTVAQARPRVLGTW